jgi:hypothetical protein
LGSTTLSLQHSKLSKLSLLEWIDVGRVETRSFHLVIPFLGKGRYERGRRRVYACAGTAAAAVRAAWSDWTVLPLI